MIETFNITGFRCFEHVRIEGLTRINVVTGANGSGKSAFLEAIYLGGNANAAAIQNIAASRLSAPFNAIQPGLAFLMPNADQTGNLATYFTPLFRSAKHGDTADTASQIKFSYRDSGQMTYDLRIAYQTSTDKTPVPVMRGIGGHGEVIPVIFHREKKRRSGQVEHSSNLPVSIMPGGQLAQPLAPPFGPPVLIFGADMNYAEPDNVTWFSQLKERNEADKLISWIRKEFPFITGIELLAPSGPTGLYATMQDGARRRMTAVSSGIYKIISILLASIHTHNGIIVIDEIENGIFYEKYSAVWRVLYDFAKETNNQIFISSHSAECLAALPSVIGDATKDFCLLRAERENGSCIIRHVGGVAVKAALQGQNEIRGAT